MMPILPLVAPLRGGFSTMAKHNHMVIVALRVITLVIY